MHSLSKVQCMLNQQNSLKNEYNFVSKEKQ